MTDKPLIHHNAQLILASSSKIRKQIMRDVQLQFDVVPSPFDEDQAKKELIAKNSSCKKIALQLAVGKALAVSKNFPTAYVIGSDQVCELDGCEMSKSNNIAEAIAQLNKLNGKTHFQNNATVIAYRGKIIFKNFSRVKLQMRQLSLQQIEAYVNSEQSFGCAGSYQYESLGKHLFAKVEGDYYSVLGLAIQPLLSFLHEQQIITFN